MMTTRYLCPFIEGENNYSHPFGLRTRFGNLIFVFQDQQLFKAYCDELLRPFVKDGHKLIDVAILADSFDRLQQEIGRRGAINSQFEVVVEGTTEFETYFDMIVDGSIWNH